MPLPKLSNDMFSSASGAVGDLFSSFGHYAKAEGDRLEAENYDRAAALARQNEQFTELSTSIKQTQLDRQIYQAQGGIEAATGASGLKMSGSALDALSDSASQGKLQHSVLAIQGIIQENAYKEQAASYDTMAQAARKAAGAEDIAGIGSDITGAIKGAATIAPLLLL